jgi:hypothetical protein
MVDGVLFFGEGSLCRWALQLYALCVRVCVRWITCGRGIEHVLTPCSLLRSACRLASWARGPLGWW